MAWLVVSLGWLVLLCSCHDAPRNNPFDPALTPPVELQVALDDTAGATTLTWTAYQGQQPFREYWILRNRVESTRVDTLERVSAVDQTTYADTSLAPGTGYEYRVSVVNGSGFAVPSEKQGISGYALGTIQLQPVEADSLAGNLLLRWRRYVGPDFAGYQVQRRVVGTDQEVLLAQIAVAMDTAFAETTALAGVDYLYTLRTQAAGQELLSNAQVGRLVLPAVEITRAELISTEASANLAWTRYRGPRFKAYQVWRRTEELAPQVIDVRADIADTVLVDSGLLGNTEYAYWVVVLTERDEQIKGAEKGGAFHKLLATWPIEGEVVGRPFVRLNREEEGVSALVYLRKPNRVWDQFSLLTFDAEGRFHTQELLNQELFMPSASLVSSQQAIALARDPGGRQFLGVWSAIGNGVGVVAWGPNGELITQDLSLFANAFAQPLSGPEASVLGEIALLPGGAFDNIAVSVQGDPVFSEKFDGGLKGWDLGGAFVEFGILSLLGQNDLVARRADESWRDFRLEADMAATHPFNGLSSIRIGGDTFSRFTLSLDRATQRAVLEWSFVPPPDVDLKPRTQRFTTPLGVLGGATYRLGLEVAQGRFQASVRTPLFWSGNATGSGWTSLAAIGETLALTVGGRPYTLTSSGQTTSFPSFDGDVGEIRTWQDRRGRRNMGVCIPGESKLVMGRIPDGDEAQWPTHLTTNLVVSIGARQGLLSYPLSFDVGPDGRIYVLDAGSGRILVYDSARRYLTQWGRQGSGEGEFSFGGGVLSQGGGSIAVDSQGYIYVADEINKRIQKFEP